MLVQVKGDEYDPSKVTLNNQNPPRRDVVMLSQRGYVVIAFKFDNPGLWLMHFHLQNTLHLDFLFRLWRTVRSQMNYGRKEIPPRATLLQVNIGQNLISSKNFFQFVIFIEMIELVWYILMSLDVFMNLVSYRIIDEYSSRDSRSLLLIELPFFCRREHVRNTNFPFNLRHE